VNFVSLSTKTVALPADPPTRQEPLRYYYFLATCVLGCAVVWAYWTTLETVADRWSNDPQYSHGWLVPVFAGMILWFRRGMLGRTDRKSSFILMVSLKPDSRRSIRTLGFWLLLTGVFLRLFVAVGMDINFVDAFSLLPTLAGLVLFVGGRRLWAWAWPAIAYLAFMLPLPYRMEIALGGPLRHLATVVSTYLLQTLGYPAISEGNVILIDQIQLGVIDACSGLGMLMTFFALATALAMVSKAPLPDRLLLVAGAIPIALIANIARITATGAALASISSEAAHAIMHDLAGWLMMPFALVLFWLEMWFLAKLLVIPQKKPIGPVLPTRPSYLGDPVYDPPGSVA